MRTLVALYCLASCTPDFVECEDGSLFVDVSCTSHPALCNLPVQSTLVDGDLDRAIDVVFVGDAYTRYELADYRRHVKRLITDLRADEDSVVGLGADLFNFHIVDVASETGALFDGDRDNTALGGCMWTDSIDGSVRPSVLGTRVLLAASSAPDVDVVVVIVDSDGGRASAPGQWVVLANTDDYRTLNHELGHALFDLGDEYVDTDACYAGESQHPFTTGPDDFIGTANLTHDPSGAKWSNVLHGAEEGGRRHGACVYHPTSSCVMKSSYEHPAFCRVCLAEINHRLRLRRERRNDGPPICVLGSDEDPHAIVDGWWSFHVRMFDRDGLGAADLMIDGEPRATFTYGPTREMESFHSQRLEPGVHSVEIICSDLDGNTASAAMLVQAL